MSQSRIDSFFGPSKGDDLIPREWKENPLPRSTPKRPVGRPRKMQKTDVGPVTTLVESDSDESSTPSTSTTQTASPLPGSKRGRYKRYTLEEKREAVRLSYEHGTTMIERRLNLPHSTMMNWRKSFSITSPVVQRDQKSGRKVGSGRKLSYGQDIEDRLIIWIKEQRDYQLPVSRERVMIYARQLVNKEDFKASNSWLDHFLKRNSYSLRTKTHQAQRLPEDLKLRIDVFTNHIQELQQQEEFDDDFIINMDETNTNYDNVPTRTIHHTGDKTIAIRGTGAEKKRVTVVLAVTASSRTLSPMVIFKGKRPLKDKCPDGLLMRVQERGWMDSSLMMDWLLNVVKPYTDRRPCMLVLDSFAGHMTEEVRALMHRFRVVPAFIPAGCTSKVQPLDVSINKPFKAHMAKQWTSHMELQLGASQGRRAVSPTRSQVLEWVMTSWENIAANPELIKWSFVTCGIVRIRDENMSVLPVLSDSDSDSDASFSGYLPEDIPEGEGSDSDPFQDSD